jgi:hypothetical protein
MRSHPFGFDRMIAGTGNMPASAYSGDMTEVELFPALEKSGFVNGAVILADGEWTAY